MFTKFKFRSVAILLLVVFALSNTACDNTELKSGISDFQQSVSLASSSVGTYFTEMNQFERDLYLQDVLLNPQAKVRPRWTTHPVTMVTTPGLFGPFHEESIKARIDAITLLGRYGERLAALAGTDSPERFNSAAQTLSTNFFNLQTTFQSLAGSDPSVRDFISPVGQIAGAIGKMILEKKRDQKLRIAIAEATPAVRAVINKLEEDLEVVIVAQRLTGNAQSLTHLVESYNCSVDPAFSTRCPKPPRSLSLEQRRDLLNKINEAAHRYELFKANNPAEVISKLRDAHEALVEYAEDRSPQNLTALIASLDSFRSSAQQVADAIIQIRNLKRGAA